MTAASHQQIWPHADRQTSRFGRNDSTAVDDYLQQFSLFDGGQRKSERHDRFSASDCSLSETDLSGSSEQELHSDFHSAFAVRSNTPTSENWGQMLFLPPTKLKTSRQCNNFSASIFSGVCGTDISTNIQSKTAEFVSREANGDYEIRTRTSTDKDSGTSDKPGSFIEANAFDIAGMREKLEAQKEFLLGSFQKPSILPQILTTQPMYFTVKEKRKPKSLKMKKKLSRLGKAANQFLNTKVFRRQPLLQKCEIQLDGYDDRVERLIVVVAHKSSDTGSKTVHVSIPSFFETNRVTLPKFLLPSKPGETITVSIYGVTKQSEQQLPNFMRVLLSGVCTVQSDSRNLLTGRLELQAHRPSHTLTTFSKTVQNQGSTIKATSKDANSYVFSSIPKPVATDFTELCVLQTAKPFREYLSLSSSTCDHPAAFEAQLPPGQFHAVCSYRIAQTSVLETYCLAASTPSVFFKTYVNKAEVEHRMTVATGLQDTNNEPLLLPSMLFFKPPGFDVQSLMQMLRCGQVHVANQTRAVTPVTEEGLYFRACHLGSSNAEAVENVADSWCTKADEWRALSNHQLLSGDGGFSVLPSLTVFNMNMMLYFADYWTYYDKHYVTLVLCPKDSPCQQVCRQHFQKLDPYNNPFLFRKRSYDPEPSVAVYASADVNVEVIYSDSASILQLISVCSENVYFSKVQVTDF